VDLASGTQLVWLLRVRVPNNALISDSSVAGFHPTKESTAWLTTCVCTSDKREHRIAHHMRVHECYMPKALLLGVSGNATRYIPAIIFWSGGGARNPIPDHMMDLALIFHI
jgi:hypothetical protein